MFLRGLFTLLILIAMAPLAAAQTDAGALRVLVLDVRITHRRPSR